jgi:hypothetical protein
VSQRSPAPTVGREICGRRVAAPMVGRRHRTVRCAPDSVQCANGPGAATVHCARFGRKSRTGQATVAVRCATRQKARWARGGTQPPPRPRYRRGPGRHSTEGKIGLPSWSSTAPSYLEAIKGTPRRMEKNIKHTLSILRLLDFAFTQSDHRS